ncbi:MAG: glycosyltransferase family 4 protein [Chloroflexi bacterium]|nr:glycosyltransferase family 4 protein [Chloroflexota bacterium]
MTHRLTRGLVACSARVKSSFTNDYHVPAQRVHIIPFGVDTHRWQPGPRREPDGRVRLLFVGGAFRRKGGQLLVDVFRSNSDELVRLYQQADAFVMPTYADVFGIVLIEAASVGLPVVSSAIAAIPEVVDDGRTGLLIPPGDGRALGEALTRLINDAHLRQELGAAGRRLALERFDPN